jgi:hypothetical protein
MLVHLSDFLMKTGWLLLAPYRWAEYAASAFIFQMPWLS